MSDTHELLDRARQLGELIAGNERVKAHVEAQRALKHDSEAQRILREYHQQVERIRELEGKRQPVEVADKSKLADLEQQVARNESLKKLMRTQADYVELMHRINQAMEAPLFAAQQPDKPSE